MTEKQKLEALGPERICVTLKRFVSIRKTAQVLKVSHTSLRRYLKEYPSAMPSVITEADRRGSRSDKLERRPHRAALVKWVKAHPDVVLPRGIKAVAAITGVSQDQVKTYLYRRRKRARLLMEDILQRILLTPIDLVDQSGEKCTPYGGSAARFEYDHWVVKPILVFSDFMGIGRVYQPESLEKFHQEVMEAAALLLLQGNHRDGSQGASHVAGLDGLDGAAQVDGLGGSR